MSGYLDVKCPARASRRLCLLKAWRKQWCILRPHPTQENTGVLALHSSVDVLTNSTIELPAGAVVCRTKSRTHEYAFGVFPSEAIHKPHILLAGQTESETQMWMAKIRAVLSGKTLCKNALLKNSFEISIIDNEFSHKCLLYGAHGSLTVSSHGLLISQPNLNSLEIFIAWKHFSDIALVPSSNASDKNKICHLITNSGFSGGAGRLSLFCSAGAELVRAVREARASLTPRDARRRISRSDGDIWCSVHSSADSDTGVRRSSWYSGPSDVSLDDTDLAMAKEDVNIAPSGQLLRFPAAEDLYPCSSKPQLENLLETSVDRNSCTSLASGIYEEIPENIELKQNTKEENKSDIKPVVKESNIELATMDIGMEIEENAYESVAECIYATMRRTGKRFLPPPLPPRTPNSSTKLPEPWNLRSGDTCDIDEVDSAVMRHSSLGSLPRCSHSISTTTHQHYTKTLPKTSKSKPFTSVFRKRIKSECRTSPTTSKSEPKKKKFDFGVTPSIEMIKNLSVSRALMKNLKITSSMRKLGEARSCEYLEENIPIAEPRSSKSVEEIGGNESTPSTGNNEDEGQDLSMVYSDYDFSLPQDIVELILKGRDDLASEQLRIRQMSECHYIAMSPIANVPSDAICNPIEESYSVAKSCDRICHPIEEHYTIMTSPQTTIKPVPNVAPDIAT